MFLRFSCILCSYLLSPLPSAHPCSLRPRPTLPYPLKRKLFKRNLLSISLWLLEPMVAMSIITVWYYIQLATQCSYHTTRTLAASAHCTAVYWTSMYTILVHQTSYCGMSNNINIQPMVAWFPGLHHLQYPYCSDQNRRCRRPGNEAIPCMTDL